jgi:hypothetical protein
MWTHDLSLVNNLTEINLYFNWYGNTVHTQMPLHDQWVEHFAPETAIATHPNKGVRNNSIFINLNMLER